MASAVVSVRTIHAYNTICLSPYHYAERKYAGCHFERGVRTGNSVFTCTLERHSRHRQVSLNTVSEVTLSIIAALIEACIGLKALWLNFAMPTQ